MTNTAFRATYSDFKLIKTRQSVQIIFEIPLQDVDTALDVLGGMPDPSKERWFAVAPLRADHVQPRSVSDKPPTGAKQNWRDMQPAQQAGIRCAEPIFQAFLQERYPEEWREGRETAECVRLICGVTSRSELGTNQKARVLWHQLDEQYQGWKVVEHA